MNLSLSPEHTAAASSPDRSLDTTSASSAIEVRIARTLSEVEEIREVWSTWNTHRDTDIDFCLNVVWQREEFIRPHVVLIYRNRRPDALLVGRLERAQIDLKIGYLRPLGIRVRQLTFAYGGLLGNPSNENSEEFVKSIVDALRQGDADVAMFHHAEADSPIYKKALSIPTFVGRDHIAKPTAHHFMVLPENIDQIELGLSNKHRKHLRSEAKRVMADFGGRVRIQCFGTPDELDRAIRDVEQIARKTYQRKLGVGFEATQQCARLLNFFADAKWLRIYVLYIDENPCAFSIGSVSEDLYCCDFLGYDPQFHKYSLGTFLLVKMFEELCKAGVKRVDFGPGGGAYKERFGNQFAMEASVCIFAPTLRGIWLNIVRTATGVTDNALRKILKNTDLLPKIKKLWRVRLTKLLRAE